MIFLTTGNPTAKVEGDQIAVEIPSGNTTVTIALSFAQARRLTEITRLVVTEAVNAANREAEATAEIIAFPREVPALARRERNLRDLVRAARVLALETRGGKLRLES